MKKSLRLIAVGLTTAVALSVIFVEAALAQSMPLEIPFAREWAGSPHANASAEAFRHWDHDGEIKTACAKCHSTYGFQDFLGVDGSTVGKVDKPALLGSTIACVACHNDTTWKMTKVTFPSGITIKNLGDESRCMTCHQGRASKGTVDAKVKGMDEDAVSKKIGFINIHYRAAAATRYGGQAKGAYEYAGKKYVGLYKMANVNACTDCHDPHTTQVQVDGCKTCHSKVKSRKDFAKIRKAKADYDGDGDVKEGVAMEIKALHGKVYDAIQAYAKQVAGTPIAYHSHNYPYFFADKNGNGKADDDEAKYGNKYKAFSPRLLKAAYNYQVVAKDPGAYTHNPKYIVQILQDTLTSLSAKITVDMKGMVRP
jgi:hypothetical protein